MAEIVSVMGMSHAPGLTGWLNQGPEEEQEVVRSSFAELRQRLEAVNPDVLVMLSNDHLLNWPLNNTPDYTVGIGAIHTGPADWFDEWLALPKYQIKGNPELARCIVREGDKRGIGFSYLRKMEFDDGFSVPLHYLTPKMQIPLVPISMNCTVPPIPSTEDSYRFGTHLKDILTNVWQGEERIAMISTGGLSHEPGGPRYLAVDVEFDRWFLNLLAKGDHEQIVQECTLERMEEAGSGGTAELLAWIAALPFTTGPAEVIGHAPGLAWRSGIGMVCWPCG